MEFKNGDRVKGIEHEFANKEGTVYQQFNQRVVLVKFDGFPMVVATTVANLTKIS